MNKYIKDYPIAEAGNLFMNKNGDTLTRSGVRARINTIVAKAADHSPGLLGKIFHRKQSGIP